MKKIFSFIILFFVFSFALPTFSFAQGMIGNSIMGGSSTFSQSSGGHTVQEEAEGKTIWEKLQAKTLTCKDLSDDNFETLGEYFMGQMAGGQHETMNNMIIQMMGEEGEKQMHIAMGKRMSGCEPNAPMPQNMTNSGMMPTMMNMLTGWFGWSLGWIFMILLWGLVILAIVALIKWIMNQSRHETSGKSPLEILKERYAEGEIDKKEFEEKKKDLI